MDDHATRDDLQGVGRALESLTESVRQSTEANTRVVQEISEALNARPAPAPQPVASSAGGAQITVNMGGWGVAVAALCAVFCLLLVLDQRSDVRDANRKIERSQDYTNMLWQQYPELRPERLKDPKK